MARSGYPRYAEHEALHQSFLADFTALQREYLCTGTRTRFAIELQRRVVDWLLHHIGKEDRAIGAYLRSGAEQAVAS